MLLGFKLIRHILIKLNIVPINLGVTTFANNSRLTILFDRLSRGHI